MKKKDQEATEKSLRNTDIVIKTIGYNKKCLTRYFTLIQNSAYFLCIRFTHFHTKNSLSFGQVNTALGCKIPKFSSINLNWVWRFSYEKNFDAIYIF